MSTVALLQVPCTLKGMELEIVNASELSSAMRDIEEGTDKAFLVLRRGDPYALLIDVVNVLEDEELQEVRQLIVKHLRKTGRIA